MASNAAAAPARPPPSFFDRLPLELVKAIVAEVDAQDKCFRATELGRTRLRASYDSDDSDAPSDGDHTRIPTFINVVNEPVILSAVQHLQLDHMDGYESRLVALALKLPQLPALTSLAINTTCAASLFAAAPDDVRGEWASEVGDDREEKKEEVVRRELARQSLHGFLGRVIDLSVTSQERSSIATILGSPAFRPGLRRLHLNLRSSLFQHEDQEVAQSLHRLAPKQLIINGVYVRNPHPSWADSLRSPDATSLTLDPRCFADSTLSIFSRITPNIDTLIVTHQALLSAVPNSLPPFPRLRHVHLSTFDDTPVLLLTFLRLPLDSLTITFEESMYSFAVNRVFSPTTPWPASLRTLRLRLKTQKRSSTLPAFQVAMRAQGIDVDVEWTMEVTDSWSGEGRKRYRRMLQDDLVWASREVEQMDLTNDEAGMREFVEVLQRLREKRVIQAQ
ncbi:hypothetical protein JCM8097_001608 [Rhodosporidiobolus ruineniae]